jgi:hypothetical protein
MAAQPDRFPDPEPPPAPEAPGVVMRSLHEHTITGRYTAATTTLCLVLLAIDLWRQ